MTGHRPASARCADAVYGGQLGGTGTSATDLELTTAWNVNAAYEHFWNPRWRTSLYGGYAAVSYGSATRYQHLVLRLWHGCTVVVTNGCDIDWNTWWSVRAPSGTSPRTSTWVWT